MQQPVHQVLSFADCVPFATFDTHLQRNADATVLVEVAVGNGDLRRGSGVVLHSHYLLTCHHVLKTEADAAAAVVKLRYRLLTDVPALIVLRPDVLFITNAALDYTLVAFAPRWFFQRPPAVVLPMCPPVRTEAEVEKGIYSLSHPNGAPLRISLAGKRVAVEELDWRTQVGFTSEVHGGSSGGGVYDAQTGHLLALITSESHPSSAWHPYNAGTNVKAIWRDVCERMFHVKALHAKAPELYIALRRENAAREQRSHFDRLVHQMMYDWMYDCLTPLDKHRYRRLLQLTY